MLTGMCPFSWAAARVSPLQTTAHATRICCFTLANLLLDGIQCFDGLQN
jgi:hypothetical protein